MILSPWHPWIQAGHRARPTALVLDFFMDGQIHDVQPDEDPALRGPGGRRKQQRRVDACDEKLGKNGWFLDGKKSGKNGWKISEQSPKKTGGWIISSHKIWWFQESMFFFLTVPTKSLIFRDLFGMMIRNVWQPPGNSWIHAGRPGSYWMDITKWKLQLNWVAVSTFWSSHPARSLAHLLKLRMNMHRHWLER